jgi:hypothetical protein
MKSSRCARAGGDGALDALPLPVAFHQVLREGTRDALCLEWVRRVHQLEVQVRGGRVPGVADASEHLACADLLPSGDGDAARRQVGVQRIGPSGAHNHVVAASRMGSRPRRANANVFFTARKDSRTARSHRRSATPSTASTITPSKAAWTGCPQP